METFGIISIKEFSKEIKTAESTVRTWKRKGFIPEDCFKTIGGRVFVKVERAKAFLMAQGEICRYIKEQMDNGIADFS